MRMLVPLLFYGLLAAGAHGVLRHGLGPRFGPRARRLFFALVGAGAFAPLVLAIVSRDARGELPAALRLGMMGLSGALLASGLALVLLSPLWIPLVRRLGRHADEAANASPPVVDPSGTGVSAPVARASDPGPVVDATPRLEAAPTPRLLTRRQVLEAAAVLPPVALGAIGPIGLVGASVSPYIRRLELAFPALPPGLEGTRIVQISDVHIGWFIDGEALRGAMEAVAREAPDLFVITGDLIDDVGQLDETMEALASVKATYGSFACLGNHEHYAGLRPIRRAYERSPIHLLVDEGTQVKTPGGTLELSGTDYPLGPRGQRMTAPDRFPLHAERALVTKAPGGDFRIHLLHHPHGWDAAAERGADLTLSGHTHGGQVGLGSRSLLHPFYKYVRGTYEQGDRRLFVHSGLGHWMPVRLGCPAEIAVITLRRGAAKT